MPTSCVAAMAQKGRTIQFIRYSGIRIAHSPFTMSKQSDRQSRLLKMPNKREEPRSAYQSTRNCVFVGFKYFTMKVKHHASSPCIRGSGDDMCPFEIPSNQLTDTPDERLPIQNKTICSHFRVVRHRKAVFSLSSIPTRYRAFSSRESNSCTYFGLFSS
jgi:hypothetical protein